MGFMQTLFIFFKSPPNQHYMTHGTKGGKVGWAGAFQNQMAHLLFALDLEPRCPVSLPCTLAHPMPSALPLAADKS